MRDAGVVTRRQETFEEDWAKTEIGKKEQKEFEREVKLATAEDVILEIPADGN